MKIFSIPLNPKLNQNQFNNYISFLKEYKDWIYDIYFTCRIAPFLQDAMGDVILGDSNDLIISALEIQNSIGIPMSATFNNINVRPDQKNLDLFIKNFKPLYDNGIRSVTIPHTTWIMTGQIQAAFPELNIKNTILRELNNAADIASTAKAGFKYINIDRDLMRNEDELKKIKRVKEKYNLKIAILANESCWGACPIMPEHFQFNNSRNMGPQYFTDIMSRVSCSSWDISHPAGSLKTANIPPWKKDWDDLLEYVDIFKMHGRENAIVFEGTMKIIENYVAGKEILIDTFKDYIEDTSLAGKPINAWRKFIKNCKFDCWDCNRCDKLYEAKNGARIPDKSDFIIETLCTTYQD